jgi:hypothetical protein
MLRPTQTPPDSYRENINMAIPPDCRQTGITTKKQIT